MTTMWLDEQMGTASPFLSIPKEAVARHKRLDLCVLRFQSDVAAIVIGILTIVWAVTATLA